MVLLTSQTHTLKALVPIVVSIITVLVPTVFFDMKPRNTHSLHCPCSNKSSESSGLHSSSGFGWMPWCLAAQRGPAHIQQSYKISPIETGGKKVQPFPSSSLRSVVERMISRALLGLLCFRGKLLLALQCTFLCLLSLLLQFILSTLWLLRGCILQYATSSHLLPLKVLAQ